MQSVEDRLTAAVFSASATATFTAYIFWLSAPGPAGCCFVGGLAVLTSDILALFQSML